jgi:hypothetical protein
MVTHLLYGRRGSRTRGKEAVTVEIGRILPTEAARILNVSPQFVRVAMQQGKLPIGTAIKMSSIWTYHISEKLLQDYSGKDVMQELEKIRGEE